MSDKLECPGCGAYSSSVLDKVRQGEPCPFCGLSAHAVTEISGVRRRRGDEQLKQQLAEALTELDRARTESATLRRQVSRVRHAVGDGPDDAGAQVLACAVCLYTSEGIAAPAVTVIGGLAVCEDHLDRAHDADLSRAIADIRKEQQS